MPSSVLQLLMFCCHLYFIILQSYPIYHLNLLVLMTKIKLDKNQNNLKLNHYLLSLINSS